jgi:hypothetical protein
LKSKAEFFVPLFAEYQTEERFMTHKKLGQPQAGEGAPDFSLSATDGSTVTLSTCPKPASITFFRHLA